MAFRRTEGMSIIQALAMTVAEIPVFVYTTFGQVQQEKSLFQLFLGLCLWRLSAKKEESV